MGLAGMLGARDDGDIPAPPYVDFEHVPGKVRNERLVADYSYALASRVNSSGARGEFVLVLGGDCSIVLGNMLGVTRRVRNEVPSLFLGYGDVMGEREALGWGDEVLYDPEVHGGLGEQLAGTALVGTRLHSTLNAPSRTNGDRLHSTLNAPWRADGERRVGLAYVDAHADYALPHESASGSAASMCLADVTGRGYTTLSRLGGGVPLVDEEDVVLAGRSLHSDEPAAGKAAVRSSRMLDLTRDAIRQKGAAAAGQEMLARLTRPGMDGFWIHLDADVVDPKYVPAVDTPEPGGLTPGELVNLLTPLVRHPLALGMEVTIVDPALGAGVRVLSEVTARITGNG